jgi:hypothetical protein
VGLCEVIREEKGERLDVGMRHREEEATWNMFRGCTDREANERRRQGNGSQERFARHPATTGERRESTQSQIFGMQNTHYYVGGTEIRPPVIPPRH